MLKAEWVTLSVFLKGFQISLNLCNAASVLKKNDMHYKIRN